MRPRFTRGEPIVWLCGAALMLAVSMIGCMVAWIVWHALPAFWPGALQEVTTFDGRVVLGEVTRTEDFVPEPEYLDGLPPEARHAADAEFAARGKLTRRLYRTGNFEVFNAHFEWVADCEVVGHPVEPATAVAVERLEWGMLYGHAQAFSYLTFVDRDSADEAEARRAALELIDGWTDSDNSESRVLVERFQDGAFRRALVDVEDLSSGDRVLAAAQVWLGSDSAWEQFEARREDVDQLWEQASRIREVDVGEANRRLESARLRLRQAARRSGVAPEWLEAYTELEFAEAAGSVGVEDLQQRLASIEADTGAPPRDFLELAAEVGREAARARAEFSNFGARIDSLEREAKRSVMWFSTSRPGVEIEVDLDGINRAYRANRLSFFDRVGIYAGRAWEFLSTAPRSAGREGGVWPAIFGTVLMTLLMCLVVVPFGVLAALYMREYAPRGPVTSLIRVAVNNLAGVPSIVFGVFGLGFFCYIVGGGVDQVFYADRLPQPTFGKGGVLWAALTLALLTAPVVIVATEEALASVPNSLREGSYACGASKWQTVRRIVLPRAMPGVLTGAILAMARGAGEVAPLMLVGVVKTAQELPIDSAPPFGLNQSFMHLGKHVYDLAFISQNSEAAKSRVYATTLLLITVVVALNLLAIGLRSRLRRRYHSPDL